METSLSRYIKEKRLQLGFTREKMAELADTGVKTLSDIEKGKVPTPKLLERIEDVFEVEFIMERNCVCQSLDSATEAMKDVGDKLEEYKEFRAIMRQLHAMNREDIHKVYEFTNSLHNAKRKR